MKVAFKVQNHIDLSSMFLTSFYNKLFYCMHKLVVF